MLNKKEYPWNLIKGWMNFEESKKWEKEIFSKLDWSQPKIKVYGKEYLVPRKTAFIGQENIKYRYSGLLHISDGWPKWFLPLLKNVCLASKSDFNGCLVNLYRNGNDKMGWHSDDEKELNPTMPISSLSLGTSRDFFLKHRYIKEKHQIKLEGGDLFIMYPDCQKEWLHSIPLRRKVISSRINLTFRCYK
ncbi:alpha-ketoglutarate-dependent dioxygenase AlkB [Prochlorococcus sp. MIT 1223]|uniref:alpha-ketoglutarate-dependent dioxygenase AlkB family protein n=1 Tax=Prochlorococcus sp. MIT 1223 TaxID=3096217 RepID=UPI002A76267F|nr:alpha-ketoglutarate-dependent dioxygenase AlkB [Prochlorococcus sp. MIT 1223]